MQLEQVMIAVAILCIALIVLLIFMCKASYDEGYASGYEDGFMSSTDDADLESKQGYENGYSDAMRKVA